MRKKLGPPELKLFDWVYVPGAGISYPPVSKPVPTIFTDGIRLGMKTSVSDQRWRPCTY